ncbi:MAG: DUF1801 domain-containing protein [Pseudomonadota bacterium]
MTPEVDAIVNTYPPTARRVFRALRTGLHRVAKREDAGPITEALKWGEPSYLTDTSKSGTTVRIAWKEKTPAQCHIYVHCQTNIIETLRAKFPNGRFEGNRAVVIPLDGPRPNALIDACFTLALTYHRHKRARRAT